MPDVPARRSWWVVLTVAGVLAAGVPVFAVVLARGHFPAALSRTPPPLPPRAGADLPGSPLELVSGRRLTVWWDALPGPVRARVIPSGEASNIAPSDYVGPAVCAKCHARNYESWSHHPHRWMNALATDDTVRGNFADASVSYRGERLTFYRRDRGYFMGVERGRVRRTYAVTQTIGSRFFQYYVGKQVEGPEPPGHPFYRRDHVLPFGYWLDQKEWAPVVHIGPEVPDDQRPDPAEPPDHGAYYADYAVSCNYCHTTFPLADLFGRRTQQMGAHAPLPLHWSMRSYLEEAHPDVVGPVSAVLQGKNVRNPMVDWEAPRYAVTLGVSCEACHLGGKEHVASGGRVPPKFFPSNPHLFVETGGAAPTYGRTRANVNWACGRCHTGPRPEFAAGMSTWNSVEYADAMRGGCYSQLRCIDCHNPHRALGPKWTPSADQDDAVCLKCHTKFEPAAPRLAHTHHPAGSAGARCLNCHMPRINEGIQDVVRTHLIYSPTRADMIEANHPNACNLCHTDRPIDWTLARLKEWYGATYDAGKVAAHYPHRDRAVALGWLESRNPSVRLVAAEALTRARDAQALPQLLDTLDDPYLVNRQFALKGLQEMLGVRLGDFGYRFYMTEEERRQPLAGLRAKFAPAPAAQGR